ncbi:hypothetical protein [Herbiconiux daphne]|uniref:Uncharacterized protein n=1 Tax=Herbiconiux daphne TaxID=2970914 RepID=A0ABT2GWF4_9MICO|nr:hypothetical protein [Herbiconiux daphne]MCS5732238.1 hypothetical protein [Herbiconiux daphne]
MTDSTTPDGESDPDFERLATDADSNQIVTNDAVAGETVYPGAGDGNEGPTGGSPREAEPDWQNYAPGEEYADESQPFGDKAPDDLDDGS